MVVEISLRDVYDLLVQLKTDVGHLPQQVGDLEARVRALEVARQRPPTWQVVSLVVAALALLAPALVAVKTLFEPGAQEPQRTRRAPPPPGGGAFVMPGALHPLTTGHDTASCRKIDTKRGQDGPGTERQR
jgi:hypothetical protein